MISKKYRWAPAIGLVLFALSLLLINLGRPGLWVPAESQYVVGAKERLQGHPVRSEVHAFLIDNAKKLLGDSDFALRLPFALLALLTLAVIGLAVRLWFSAKAAWWAVLIALTTPLILLNGRLLSSLAPSLFLQSLLGLALWEVFRQAEKKKWASVALWGVSGLIVALLSALSSGVLLGVLPPLWALVWTRRGRTPLLLAHAALAILLTLKVILAIVAHQPQFNVWTGASLAASRPLSFSAPWVQLVHALAPWSALLPWAYFESTKAPDASAQPNTGALVNYCMFWIIGLVMAQTIFSANYGLVAPLALLPGSCLVAHLLAERRSLSVVGWFACVGILGLIIRDYALYPTSLLHAVAVDFSKIETASIGKSFWPVTLAIFACTLLIFIPAVSKKHRLLSEGGWLGIFSGAALWAAMVVFVALPKWSERLSTKHHYERYLKLSNAQSDLIHYRVDPSLAQRYLKRASQEFHNPHQVVQEMIGTDAQWALLTLPDFGKIAHLFFRGTGKHLFADRLPDSGPFLVANYTPAKWPDHNPIRKALLSHEPELQHPVKVKFAQGITLLGYRLSPDKKAFRHKEKFTLGLVFRAGQKISGNWRIFVHIDVTHGIDRIHGDHNPVNDLYGTEFWEPGNIILDEKTLRVPRNVRKGTYRIHVGFYAHDVRMPILQGRQDDEKRAILGTIEVR